MNSVLRHLRRAALLSAGEALTDAQLLEAFLTRREEAAFEVLLRRHGPMVLGVCRRVLHNLHDAEDAFQATFLVLARKASSVRSLASWLYGVAYRTATKARAMNAKRRTKEKQAGERRPPEPSGDGVPEELLARLDAELNRLPDKYRVPVVLCDLEGKTRREAARLLGLPEGTLSWRLARAKKLLAQRLARHGAALSGGALATLLSHGTSSAALSPSLLTSTAKAGVLAAAGQALTAGVVSAKVLALTEGVTKAMLLSKLKVFWAVALVVAVSTTAGLTYRAVAQEPVTVRVERVFDAQSAGRPAPDDLDALRLEIEALRKEVRAMRERMKALEAQVGAQKGAGQAPVGASSGAEWRPDRTEWRFERWVPNAEWRPDRTEWRFERGAPNVDPLAEVEAALKKLRQNPNDKQAAEALEPALKRLKEQRKLRAPVDPLAEAEAALKKLRQNPNDKQATDALEQALKRLKEQRKPDGATRGGNPGKN